MSRVKSKIEQLAGMTGNELSTESDPVLPENLFPPVARRQVENPTAPVRQLQPTGQQERRPTDPAPQIPMQLIASDEVKRFRGSPIEAPPDAPAISETIKAMLIMTGLRAAWSMNFWRVYLPESSQIVANIGGKNRRRWQTGINATAPESEWMIEINRFWKDVHPNEQLPFGQV